MKRDYQKPTTSMVEIQSEGILAGSVTPCQIEVSSVEVEEFQDGGTIDISFD